MVRPYPPLLIEKTSEPIIDSSTESNKVQVVVIGAGVSGLAAASYLCAEGLEVYILEQKEGPGGLWNPEFGRHWEEPVYSSLETNIPRQLMTFSDHPWDPTTPLHPHNSQVKKYLHQYANALEQQYPKNLRFVYGCHVNSARQLNRNQAETWEINVEHKDFGNPHAKKTLYSQLLVVSAGNYNHPYIIDYPGSKEWHARDPSSVIHAMNFAEPESYRDKNVLIVGYSASGFDISAQIAPFAKNVIVSTSRPNQQFAPGVQTVVGSTESFNFLDNRSVLFHGGLTVKNVDKVILCTGYTYNFNFLKKRDGSDRLIPQDLRTIPNLFQHILYMDGNQVKIPSLAFVGLPTKALSFTVAEAQSALVARAFARGDTIPNRAQQQAWKDKDMEAWKSSLPRNTSRAMARELSYHEMTDFGKQYINQLWEMSKWAGPVNGLPGKPAPYWCRCFDKVRELMPEARAKFKASSDGEKRLITKFEDLFGRGCIRKCSRRRKAADGTDAGSCFL